MDQPVEAGLDGEGPSEEPLHFLSGDRCYFSVLREHRSNGGTRLESKHRQTRDGAH